MKRYVAALLCACVLAACSGPAIKEPEIRVVDLAGLEKALAEYRGKGVLLNFWAMWCEPCVAEMPELLETVRNYRGRGGAALGVSYDLMVPDATRDEVLQRLRSFVAEHGIDIPVLVYEADDYDAINQRFGLPGPIPVTLALDAGGAIVDREEKQAGRARFEAMMRKALGENGDAHRFR